MPWAVLVLAVIVLASYFSTETNQTTHQFRVWSLEHASGEQTDYALLRAFVSPTGHCSIALEGGRQPIFAAEVPSVALGAASDRPLQLLLLGDWDSQETRSLYRQLETMYRDDLHHMLPSLSLTLLPSRTGASQGHFLEWIIAVHFVANQVTTQPKLLGDISAGRLAADKEMIRKRLDEIEPEISARADTVMRTQNKIIERVYLIARAQLRLNEKALQCREPTQLVAMNQILTGSPGEQHLTAFLLHAKQQQDAFLASPAGLIPVEPKRPR